MMEGFERIEQPTLRRRVIIATEGLEKTGKTTFGLSAPGPIAYFDLDRRSEGVVDQFVKTKVIYRRHFNLDDEQLAKDEWATFVKLYEAALREPEIRTIFIDTWTEAWELARVAEFGRRDKVLPWRYGPINAEFRRLMYLPYQYDKNVIFAHKMKKRYVSVKTAEGDLDSGWDGSWERAGFSGGEYIVQANLRHSRIGKKFTLTFLDCGINAECIGRELSDHEVSFSFVASLMVPGTQPTDWL